MQNMIKSANSIIENRRPMDWARTWPKTKCFYAFNNKAERFLMCLFVITLKISQMKILFAKLCIFLLAVLRLGCIVGLIGTFVMRYFVALCISQSHFLPSLCQHGRCSDLMVSAFDSGANSLHFSHGQGQCLVFLGKTLYSHSASLYPDV